MSEKMRARHATCTRRKQVLETTIILTFHRDQLLEMAVRYSLEERCRISALMHVLNSTAQVRKRLRQEFHERIPDHKTVRRMYNSFVKTGSVERKKYERSCNTTGDVNQIRVQAHFQDNPTCSIRQAKQELDLSFYAVQRCLKKVTLKPYRIGNVQGLLPGDPPRRVDALSVLAQMVEMDPDIKNRIVFSDEATFHVSGFVNSSLCRYWAYENPQIAVQHHSNSPKVNVWCGMTSRGLVGPFLFVEQTINYSNYLDMLQNFAVPIMHDLGVTSDGYFMQDGAPPHWALDVREYLDEVFPGRWIGRDGPLAWPPRSPDITPCDFFLWGTIKNKTYRTPVATLEDLRERILTAFLEIRAPVFDSVFEEMIDRWHCCIGNGGVHVEKSIVM